MKSNKNNFAFNGTHLQNIKSKFAEKTGVQLKHNSIRRFKPKAMIAATVIIAVFLMSATFIVITQRVFDADGNSFLQYIPFRNREPLTTPTDERSLFEMEFSHYENNENIWLRVIRGDENESIRTSFTEPHRFIYDYEELIKYTDENVFKLPQYIPEGYKFSAGEVTFFLDENFSIENSELVYHEEKFGNIYEKYYIPEKLENMEQLSINYIKEENGKEVYLSYTISLHDSEYINVEIVGLENTQGKILQMPQFERNILMSTDYEENGNRFTQRHFTGINTITTRHGQNTWGKAEYGTVEYRINTYSLNHDEILQIAESIK